MCGVPDFLGDPAGAFGGEPEHSDGVGLPGEDAVAAGEFAVQGGFGDGFGGLGQRLDGADAFDGEVAQAFFVVAPGVEVPVVAVVGEALGGNFAGAGLVAFAVVVVDREPVALQDGMGDGLEVARVFSAGGEAEQTDALGGFACAEVLAFQQLVDADLQRAQMVVEQAGFQMGQQVFKGDEGEQFVGAEPQAGQGVAAVGGFLAIAVAVLVVDERCAEFVAQIGDQAGQGGT